MIPPADKKILERARPKLTGSISLDGSSLLDELRSRGAITENNQQIIEEEKGDRKQAAKLLDFLLKGGVDTLDKFIYSLRDSEHTELANDCLRKPNKPDKWDDDTAAGGQPASAHASGATAANASSATPGSSGPMTDTHKQTIIDNFDELATSLSSDGILIHLVKHNIISADEQEDLLEQRTTRRAGALLRLIMKREDRAFYVLRDACAKCKMPHLAEMLQD